jgi:Nif11 domain
MSKDAALAFLKKIAEDAEMQKKLAAFAREQGYEFTVDDLTDEELGGVTGGSILSTYLKFVMPANPYTVKIESPLMDKTSPLMDKVGL